MLGLALIASHARRWLGRAALPEASIEVRTAGAVVQRPQAAAARRPVAPPSPASPRCDPFEWYCPNPFGAMLTGMVWGSLFSMAAPPDLLVVDGSGQELGPFGANDYGGDPSGGDFGGRDFDGGGDFGGGDFDV